MTEPIVTASRIEGLYEVKLVIHEDDRGSFREVYQAAKMQAAGLPEFHPIQQSASESKNGVIRGIHAEPWDKFIHVVHGEAFAAIVDLRPDSPTFKQYETFTLNRTNAIFVSRGLGNSFQAVTDVVYSYLVNAHWSQDAKSQYVLVNYADPELAIPWPIKEAIVSEDDQNHPTIKEKFGQ